MPPEQQNSDTIIRAGALLVILLLVLGGVLWLTGNLPLLSVPPAASIIRTPVETMSSANDLYRTLIVQNTDFSAGVKARAQGDVPTAEVSFSKALSETTDHALQGMIQFWLSDTYAADGKYDEAIGGFKKIAADTGFAPIVRAYAVQAMGLMYYRHNDPHITNAVFTGAPYDGMRVSGQDSLSYRHLFEYTTSFYPLSFSEFYIAAWYGNDALQFGAGKTSGSALATSTQLQIAGDLDAIRTHMQAGNTHLAVVYQGRMIDPAAAESEELHAVMLGKLALLSDTSFGDAEAAFKSIIATYESIGASAADGSVRIQYATFLARKYGAARSADIQAALAPVLAVSKGSQSPLVQTAAQFKSQPASYIKTSYALLASYDPDFKSLLRSAGWSESDLSTK